MGAMPRTALLTAAALAIAGLTAPAAHAAVPEPAYQFAKAYGATLPQPLDRPLRLAVGDGKLVVTQAATSRIWIEDLATGDVTFADHPDLAYFPAVGVAVHDGELYAPSFAVNAVLVFGLDGTYRRAIEAPTTSGPGSFRLGNSIDIADDGTIYAITATGPVRVMVLPPDGEPWLLGEQSDSPGLGQYDFPGDVDVAPDGSVYVTDLRSHRVLRYAADGEFLSSFGVTGTGPGELSYPRGVEVDAAGLVYVAEADYLGRVQVFAPGGRHLTTIAPADGEPGSLRGGDLGGVALDDAGRLYVANASLNGAPPTTNPVDRVVAFDPVMAAWELPVVSGAAVVGGKVSVDRGLWPGGVPVSVQWLRGGAAIPGATGVTYVPTAADVGRALGVRVTGVFGSRGSVPVTLAVGTVAKAVSSVSLAAAKGRAGARPKVKVTVSGLAGVSPAGTVTIRRGSKVLATATLKASHRGKITVALPKLKVGRYSLTATFSGDASLLPSSSAVRLTVAKARAKVSLKLAAKKVASLARAKVRVTVKVAGFARPTGKVTFYDGKKKLTVVKLKAKHKGKVTVTLPRLTAGKHELKVSYTGTKQIAKKTSAKKTLTVAR